MFINICGSDKVPMAGGWTNGKVSASCKHVAIRVQAVELACRSSHMYTACLMNPVITAADAR